ncbi:hypothetical protein P2W49_14820 [Yersinia intermedia]|nr:hypothetical protein P2W49_14820 [Yersinia intermedia]
MNDCKPLPQLLWLKRYSELLKRRELAENAMKMRVLQIGYINQEFENKPLKAVTTKHIVDFINTLSIAVKVRHCE